MSSPPGEINLSHIKFVDCMLSKMVVTTYNFPGCYGHQIWSKSTKLLDWPSNLLIKMILKWAVSTDPQDEIPAETCLIGLLSVTRKMLCIPVDHGNPEFFWPSAAAQI